MNPTFTLRSDHTSTEYWIHTAPEDAAAADRHPPRPGVLFLDGDDQFRFALEAYTRLRAENAVAPLALFGVGYGARYTQPGNRRSRDYTPTAAAESPTSGGAEPFVQFLTEELWPELARRFALRDDARGIGGHSLGSLLALHALLRPRPFFSHVLASAPSLWWDNRALVCAAGNLQRTGAAVPAKLWLGVGEEDSASMTGDLELFENQLAAAPFPGLTVTSRRFPKRNHFNVLPEAFAAGLRDLFPPTER